MTTLALILAALALAYAYHLAAGCYRRHRDERDTLLRDLREYRQPQDRDE
jgi:hypothetical protein